MSDAATPQIYLEDAGNLVAALGPVLIQVRRGELTLEVVERIHRTAQLVRASRRGQLAFLAIVEDGAPPATGEARERQREAIVAFAGDGRTRMAAVTLGDALTTSLHRTMARGFARQGASIFAAASVEEAVRWLATEHEGVDERALLAAAASLRARLAAAAPA